MLTVNHEQWTLNHKLSILSTRWRHGWSLWAIAIRLTRRQSILSCVRVMSKVPSGNLCNAEMIVELFRPQLEHHPSNIFHRSAIIHHPSYSYLCRRYKQYNYEQFKDYYNQESFQEVGREDSWGRRTEISEAERTVLRGNICPNIISLIYLTMK